MDESRTTVGHTRTFQDPVPEAGWLQRRLRGWGGILATLLSATLCSGAEPSSPAVSTAGERLRDLVDDHFEETLALDPLFASFIGDHRFDDRLAIDIAPEHRARRRALAERSLAAVDAVPEAGLSEEDRLTRELFLRACRLELEALEIPEHLLPLDHFESLPILFGTMGTGGGLHPFATIGDYDRFLSRAADFSRWIDQAIVNLEEGRRRGIVHPRSIVERMLQPLDELSTTESSPFLWPIEHFPGSVGTEDRHGLSLRFEEAITRQIAPAYRHLADYLRTTYLPAARSTIGLDAIPGGRAWYRHLVRRHTTTDRSPNDLHRLGLLEVQRIRREMDAVAREAGHRSAASFSQALSADPELRFSTVAEVFESYRDAVRTISPRLDRIFSTRPVSDFEILPVEPFRAGTAPGASYLPGAIDGSRPGIFYVNPAASASRLSVQPLVLHEAIPGHHFQIALQREATHLPRFRRFGGPTVFVEGWALYAESLAPDLGLDPTPPQRFAALRMELVRAERLVLDTGIHALGWSRDEAIALAGSAAVVDRYTAMPGQALAYKVGELRLLELRRRAEKKLGSSFDLATFHRTILEAGALPLDLLEERVEAWIRASR